LYNNKPKRAISYTRASEALFRNTFVNAAFGVLKLYFAYSIEDYIKRDFSFRFGTGG